MTKAMLSALGLVLAAACTQSETTQEPSQAASAIQALSERDDARVARCNGVVEACIARRADAASSDVCNRLAEHCTTLGERLAEVRSSAVGCWRAVEECTAHTPEQAQCNRDASECETLEDDSTDDRANVVDCSERIEACVTRVAELPAEAAGSCENIAAACEHRAAAGSKKPDAGKGDEQGGDDDEGDVDDGAEDTDDGNGGGNGPRRDPPGAANGHGRQDAGAE